MVSRKNNSRALGQAIVWQSALGGNCGTAQRDGALSRRRNNRRAVDSGCRTARFKVTVTGGSMAKSLKEQWVCRTSRLRPLAGHGTDMFRPGRPSKGSCCRTLRHMLNFEAGHPGAGRSCKPLPSRR